MKNVILRSGLLIGLILSVFIIITGMFMTAESDLSTSENIGYAVMFSVFGFILFTTIRKERDENLGGIISFGKVFKMGMMSTIIAAILYSFSWTVFVNVSDKDFMELFLEMTINEMQDNEATDDEISIVIEQFEAFKPFYEKPLIMFFITLIEPILPGLITTLILGFILRRNQNTEVVSTSEE